MSVLRDRVRASSGCTYEDGMHVALRRCRATTHRTRRSRGVRCAARACAARACAARACAARRVARGNSKRARSRQPADSKNRANCGGVWRTRAPRGACPRSTALPGAVLGSRPAARAHVCGARFKHHGETRCCCPGRAGRARERSGARRCRAPDWPTARRCTRSQCSASRPPCGHSASPLGDSRPACRNAAQKRMRATLAAQAAAALSTSHCPRATSFRPHPRTFHRAASTDRPCPAAWMRIRIARRPRHPVSLSSASRRQLPSLLTCALHRDHRTDAHIQARRPAPTLSLVRHVDERSHATEERFASRTAKHVVRIAQTRARSCALVHTRALSPRRCFLAFSLAQVRQLAYLPAPRFLPYGSCHPVPATRFYRLGSNARFYRLGSSARSQCPLRACARACRRSSCVPGVRACCQPSATPRSRPLLQPQPHHDVPTYLVTVNRVPTRKADPPISPARIYLEDNNNRHLVLVGRC